MYFERDILAAVWKTTLTVHGYLSWEVPEIIQKEEMRVWIGMMAGEKKRAERSHYVFICNARDIEALERGHFTKMSLGYWMCHWCSVGKGRGAEEEGQE